MASWVNGSRELLKSRADDELRVGGPDGIYPSVWVKVESDRNPTGCTGDTVSRETLKQGPGDVGLALKRSARDKWWS